MNTITLEGMEFFAFHGFYEEERKIGNKYTVDITVYTDFSKAASEDELKFTVNYERLYRVVFEEMSVSSKLLENIANRIIEKVKQTYPMILGVEVNLAKHNPPIGGVCAKAKICIRKDFNS